MSGEGRSRVDEVRQVIIVTNALAPDKLGGLERYVRELAAGLVRQGLRVTVLTKRVHPEHPAREVGPDGVAVVRHDVPSKRLRTFALRYPFHVAAAVWREVGHLEPGTVVHAHYAMPALPLALRGIPTCTPSTRPSTARPSTSGRAPTRSPGLCRPRPLRASRARRAWSSGGRPGSSS